MKNISVTLLCAGLLLASACNENSNTNADQTQTGMATDSGKTGLEGTRDQSAQLSTQNHPDTSLGQNDETRRGIGLDSAGKSDGKQFLAAEVSANEGEVALAKLAQQQAVSQELKSIASSLIKDHTAAISELKNLSASKGVTLSSNESMTSQKMADELKGLSGKDFEKKWCEQQVNEHNSTITRYETAAKNISDADVKKWINNSLPKLHAHHDKLVKYQKKIR